MIRQQLNEALKEAMKAKNQRAVATIRLILAALKDRDIAARSRGNTDGIPDHEILAMLQTMVRQRKESIEMYEQGGRLDLVEGEQEEIEIIQGFLPPQMNEEETRRAVREVIDDIGARGLKDVGRCMAELRGRYAGRMDYGRASNMVRHVLG